MSEKSIPIQSIRNSFAGRKQEKLYEITLDKEEDIIILQWIRKKYSSMGGRRQYHGFKINKSEGKIYQITMAKEEHIVRVLKWSL